MKIGLALEGGGSRGSFHIGAVKALLEEGYELGGVVGTSVGALNGSLIAQGDFERIYDFWYNMKPGDLFDIDEEALEKLMNKRFDKSTRNFVSSFAKDFVNNKGIDTAELKGVVAGFLDEEKLRKSPVDFGLVTISVNDLKPLELTKKDIPEGKMLDYIMASARLPVFKQESIDKKYFLDGGVANNCPIDMLGAMGLFDVIAVRTLAIGKVPKVKDSRIKMRSIMPSEDLGFILNFDNALMRRNIKMGYYDAKRLLHGYKGLKYYVDATGVDGLGRMLAFNSQTLQEIHKIYGNVDGDSRRMFFENILPSCAVWLKIPPSADYEQFLVAMIERVVETAKIDKYKVYTFEQFLDIAKSVVSAGNWPPAKQSKNKNTLSENLKLLLADERQHDIITAIIKAL